ncbi:MAG: thiamine pyrophosphate-requiring protein [Rhodospirillales bacterium]|jgi:thiamine pyrophosphate-dependent acetolactate synthase large subunit-like protein|nr:thiamine pyrophosphate-requiring protein [Rhodospirillales bacterium]
MRGVDVIARILKAEGVEFVTCFPMNPILDAVAAVGIRPIVVRNERVALNIADAVSRMTSGRRIGVSVTQYGPGSENSFPGVAEAYSDSSPILVLAGANERSTLSVSPNFNSGRTFKTVSKWSESVLETAQIPLMMGRAFSLLRSGKGGPVVLEFPKDVMLADFEESEFAYVPTRRSSPAPERTAVRDLLDLLLAAKKPILYAGQGVIYAEAWDELKAFAEFLQIPVMTSLNGKGAFPENHPLSIGAANGLSRADQVNYFLGAGDLFFGIGTSFTRSIFIAPFPKGKTFTQICMDEGDFNKDYATTLGVLGDAKAALAMLLEEARERLGKAVDPGDGGAQEVQAQKGAFFEAWNAKLTSGEKPISPYRVISELKQLLDPERSVVTHDAGSPRDQLVPLYEAQAPYSYLSWGKSTPLGSGLGLIMGAKLAHPDWDAVNVMGEAAFGMVGMDFETAVRENIPIMTVVFNNGVMGGYTKKQPIAVEKYQVNELTGNYSAVAEALGGYAERVHEVEELRPALERGLESTRQGRAALIEVMVVEDFKYPGT